MSQPDIDIELRTALRDDAAEVSPDFNRRVIEQMDRRNRPSGFLRPALVAAAAGLILAVGALLWSTDHASQPQAERAEQREQLRDEYRALEMELRQLREMADAQEPVLYLGGDESFELVYDLASYRSDEPTGDARPASLPDRG